MISHGLLGSFWALTRVGTAFDAGEPDFFTHRNYWEVDGDRGYHGPHIAVLRDAIDLADAGLPNRRQKFPAEVVSDPSPASGAGSACEGAPGWGIGGGGA